MTEANQTLADPAVSNLDGAILTYVGVVYPWQMDHMGHLNVQHYVGLFDQANWSFATEIGLGSEEMKSQGLGLAALEQSMSYLKEVTAGERLKIFTKAVRIARKTYETEHFMVRSDGVMIAKMKLLEVLIDTQKRKGVPLPKSVVQRLQELVDAEYASASQNC